MSGCGQGLLLALCSGITSGGCGRPYIMLGIDPRFSVCKISALHMTVLSLWLHELLFRSVVCFFGGHPNNVKKIWGRVLVIVVN